MFSIEDSGDIFEKIPEWTQLETFLVYNYRSIPV